ncbi:MAG TPA: ABC transporter ATP-binding protein [Thermodesulfobacteriota bacterium]|nr:ABC transporter ATP-binding protein [Thermodesulfobacteriota bacterium]
MHDETNRNGRVDGKHLLRVDGITKSFSGLTALSDVSFGIERSHIKALIGPNGAGKTTLLNIISGLLSPDSGHVYYRGRDLMRLRPHEIAAQGLSRTFQLVRLFTANNAKVLDNLLIGAHSKLKPSLLKSLFLRGIIRHQHREVRERAYEQLRFVGLERAAGDTSPSNLPFGNQRLLEIARALMAEPEVLLLDEPASGLNDAEVEDFKKILLALKEKGMTILLVEHNMKLIMDVADEIVVLDFGRKLAEGNCDEISRNRKVIEAYLGSDYTKLAGGNHSA